MHENGISRHETAKLGRSKGVREFGTKGPPPKAYLIARDKRYSAVASTKLYGKLGTDDLLHEITKKISVENVEN